MLYVLHVRIYITHTLVHYIFIYIKLFVHSFIMRQFGEYPQKEIT